MIKYLKFRIHELSLAVPVEKVRRELEKVIGEPLETRRMPLGHGWSLKYLAYSGSQSDPVALIKIASRTLERRVRASVCRWYAAPPERYRKEADVLAAMATLDLAPDILLVGDSYQVRKYTNGVCLAGLPEAEIAAHLPAVLDAIETALSAGIFHTDTNAGNVIVTGDGRYHFIDSEPPSGHKTGDPVNGKYRAWCHERMVATLARYVHGSVLLADTVRKYYSAMESAPLSPERAAALLTGKAQSMEYPV